MTAQRTLLSPAGVRLGWHPEGTLLAVREACRFLWRTKCYCRAALQWRKDTGRISVFVRWNGYLDFTFVVFAALWTPGNSVPLLRGICPLLPLWNGSCPTLALSRSLLSIQGRAPSHASASETYQSTSLEQYEWQLSVKSPRAWRVCWQGPRENYQSKESSFGGACRLCVWRCRRRTDRTSRDCIYLDSLQLISCSPSQAFQVVPADQFTHIIFCSTGSGVPGPPQSRWTHLLPPHLGTLFAPAHQ